MAKVRSKQQLSKEIDELKRKCCCAGGSFEDITYVEALSLVSTSTLKPGTLYRISGVHKNKEGVTIPVLYDDGNNSGTTIYLTALTTSEFSTEGWGEFYNPRYDQENYGILDLQVGQQLFATTAGTGYTDALNVSVTGGSGTGMTLDISVAGDGLQYVLINTLGSGYINGDIIIVDAGNNDGTITILANPYLYNIWDGDNPAMNGGNSAPDRKIIWGGYVWEHGTFNDNTWGTANSIVELNDESWTKVAYNTTDYAFVIDYIEYDWANDWILRRRQAEPVIDVIFPFQFWNSAENTQGIVLHGISVAQWGNKFNKDTELGTGLVICTDAYFEFCNFKGSKLLGFNLNNYSYIKDNYYGIDTVFKGVILTNYSYIINSVFDTGAYQYYIQIDNASGQTGMEIIKNCYQDDIRISNNSTQSSLLHNTFTPSDSGSISYQKHIVIDNGSSQNIEIYDDSYQKNVHVLNGSSQVLIIKEGCFQYYVTVNNGSTQNLEFNAYVQEYGTITDFSSQFNGILTDADSSYFSIIGATIDYQNTTLSPTLTHAEITEKEIIYKFKTLFTGSATAGQVGAFTLLEWIIPDDFFISQVMVESAGLTGGAGAYLTLGIETDDVDAALTNVTGLITTLMATPIQVLTPAYTKSSGLRKLVAAVGGNTISAGSCNFIITLTKLTL